MVKNEHNVPPRQWNKWSDQAKRVFNSLHWNMMNNARLFLPPGTKKPEGWGVTAWNVSWTAADAVMEEEKAAA